MGKMLYLECYSGISGDMTVGALLDLGASREVLETTLGKLGIEGYHLHFGRKKKCGIDAYDFDVHLECTDTMHSHGSDHSHEHDHHHNHDHHHAHDHDHGHNHDHHHSYDHHHHRNIQDILNIIDRLDAKESVKVMARSMFQVVAEAESKAHGIPVEHVHFHEVGAIDSIIDILSVAICLENLGIDQVMVSPLSEGRGFVTCAHGIMPVPVPATANIAAAHGLELRLTDNEGEMVTPTGAAIAAVLQTKKVLPDHYTIEKIGIGAGNKEFKNANILRAMIIHPVKEQKDKMWILECNIDDSTGEMLGFAMERLFEAGASDVWYTPIFMKKNRPAYQLQVLCTEELAEVLESIVFDQTTTIGIRKYAVARSMLERRMESVITQYGEAKVKVCTGSSRIFYYPEYESVRAICLGQNLDFQQVYYEIITCAQNMFQ